MYAVISDCHHPGNHRQGEETECRLVRPASVLTPLPPRGNHDPDLSDHQFLLFLIVEPLMSAVSIRRVQFGLILNLIQLGRH